MKHRLLISALLLGGLIIPSTFFVYAETVTENVESQKTELQKQLEEIEKEIAGFEKELGTLKGEKDTLQNKINQLKKQQSVLSLQMKQNALEVKEMDAQIKTTGTLIDDTQARSDIVKMNMAETMRRVQAQDQRPLIFAFFSEGTVFDALTQMEAYANVGSQLAIMVEELQKTQKDLETQKQQLDDQQEHVQALLQVQQLQQQALVGSEKEQAVLLQETKGKEQNYQAVLADSKKRAAEVKTRLYQLLNVGTQITFGQAVEIAMWVSEQTGVRAAFILSVLTQESNLGKNVGTCNRPGDPPEKSWKVIMKPTRDQEPFKSITAELGLDPDTTAVSCPMRDKNGKQVGWGGAMGPAQFIPSTWVGYRDKVAKITGKPANPWDIRDAFIAAAVKLGADGAKTVSGEWAAAMRYFSGSTNVQFRFYGDQVVARANAYQEDIEALQGK